METPNAPEGLSVENFSGDVFEHDELIRKRGFHVIAGVDEAGRGPLAGPVTAAAVILPEGLRIDGIRDSKKIPEKEREHLFWEIVYNAASIGVGIVDAEDIDRINILRATKLAMHTAISNLKNMPHIILIDAVSLPSVKVRQYPIIKGDARSASIGAASIVAKVIRDRMMAEYHAQYPHYGFDKHKGYGTRLHIESIKKYGPSPIHRKTFQKVMNLELHF